MSFGFGKMVRRERATDYIRAPWTPGLVRQKLRVLHDRAHVWAALRVLGPRGAIMSGELRIRYTPAPIPMGGEEAFLRKCREQLGMSRRKALRFMKWHIRMEGKVVEYGVVGIRVVTDAGVGALVNDWDDDSDDITAFNQHDSGTGSLAEAVGQTALQTPNGESRDAGTKSQPAANQLRTVATHTYAGTFAIKEHGLFDAGAGGDLWDRTVFAAINVVSGDGIEFTYTCTITSGS